MPASILIALRRADEAAPSNSLVLPVTILPSGSSIAAAGFPSVEAVASLFSSTKVRGYGGTRIAFPIGNFY